MPYKIAPLFCRPWTLNGISPRLIESHYENDYGNALSSLNAITAELEALDPATWQQQLSTASSAMKRRCSTRRCPTSCTLPALVVLCQEGARAPCCTRDEGRPFGAVL